MDHCPYTGIIRGVLCRSCNSKLLSEGAGWNLEDGILFYVDSVLYAAGVSPEQARYYLGHSDSKTTEMYLHEAEELRNRLEHSELAQLGLEGF